MSNIQPYEVSLWMKYRNSILINNVNKTYFQEKRVCVLASDTLYSDGQIFNIIFTEKTDGSRTLAFSLFKSYVLEDVIKYNKFYNLLHNESLIKIFYDNEWHDFLIKNIDEDKDSNLITYNCIDAFVDELSRTGYKVILDTELENNFGTVTELATVVLDGTNWAVDENLSDIIIQKLNSPLYAATALAELTVEPMTDDFDSSLITAIPIGATFYYCYNSFHNRENELQILYRIDEEYLYDDDFIIYNCDNFIAKNITFEEGLVVTIKQNNIDIIENHSLDLADLQGKRVVKAQLNQYEVNSQKYVLLYKDGDDNDVYGYTESEYITGDSVQNLITNNKDFVDMSGFKYKDGLDFSTLLDPIYDDSTPETKLAWLNATKKQYLKVKFTPTNELLCNTGMSDNRTIIDGLTEGESYTLKLKYDSGLVPGSTTNGLDVVVCKYTFINSTFTLDLNSTYFTFDNLTLDTGYYIQTALCEKTAIKADLTSIGIFIIPKNSALDTFYFLEDLQLFKTMFDANNNQIFPDTVVTSEVKTKYTYFNLIQGEIGEDAVNYLYIDYIPDATLTPQYDSSYNKISSLSEAKSNCFNLLQKLAETFECWLKISITHDASGAITLDNNYDPIKKVYFKNYFGIDNPVGFHYGINLNNTQRKIISEEITTKLIVENSDNEYLPDGTCSIARAVDNVSKEGFILNFNYYINKGMLNYNQVLKDLYGTSENDLAYLTKLGTYNTSYDSNASQLVAISANLLKLEAQKITYENAVLAAETEIAAYKNDLFFYINPLTYNDVLAGSWSALIDSQPVQDIITSIQNLLTQQAAYNALLVNINAQIAVEEASKITLEAANTAILADKEALHQTFYSIYADFIKEATWTDNSYSDDNLYYLDGASTLNNSAHPKLEYTIDVIDVSAVSGLESFVFHIGDRTFLQDEEYFGYIIKEGLLTPYRQEIIISEYARTLDDPSQNKITVKTYKYNYTDLFQQMAATTQSLQYAEGGYGRAASAILPNGQISVSVLQETLFNNSVILANAKNQSVIWDENGISISNLLSHNELVRMVSGGIFLSKDGGDTWTAGITANGINTSLLTAGRIDVNKIFILNETTPTFRWTADGINAYRWNEGDGSFDLTSFIRLDQYGLYGINDGSENFKPTGATLEDQLDSIRNNAQFALLWDGFFLKSAGTAGYLKISSEDDIQIFQDISQDPNTPNYVDRLTLGRINDNNNLYGLELKHNDGKTSFISDSEGNLTLAGIITLSARSIVDAPTVTVGVVYTDSNKDTVKEFISVVQNDTYKFQVDGDGNVYVAGEIVAESGTIGGFVIGASSLYSTDGRMVISPTALTFYDKISTDPTRIKVFDFSILNNVGQLALRGAVDIIGSSSVLGTLSVGSLLNSERIIVDGNTGAIYHTNFMDSESDSGFLIDNTGKIFARAIELGDYASIKNYLKMGNSYIYNPTYQSQNLFLSVRDETTEYASLNNYGVLTVKRFIVEGNPSTVSVNGSNVNTNVINGGLLINGYLQVGTDGVIINGVNGNIYNYSYGINNAKGWSINKDGGAVFNNVNVRGKLQSTIFEYNKLSSVGGRLLISPSIQVTVPLAGTVVSTNVKFEFITFVDNDSPEQIYNQELALIWANVNQGSVDIDGVITEACIVESTITTLNNINTTHITIKIPISKLSTYLNGGIYTLPKGTLIISTSTDVNNIVLSAQEVNGPRISMTPNDGGIGTVYIGNLNNIVTNTFGPLTGYGFYGENVFLEGKLYLPNAGITNDGSSDSSIRIWAGAAIDNISEAKFFVTQGGFLHAEEGEFSGKIKNAVLETSSIVGVNGLNIYGNSPLSFFSGNVTVSGTGVITGTTVLKLKIDADGLVGTNSDILFKATGGETLFKVDTITKQVTLNGILLNGLKTISIKEHNSGLELLYGQNSALLTEQSLTTPQVITDTLQFTNKMYIGDTKAYYLNIKNGTTNIGYDVYILS